MNYEKAEKIMAWINAGGRVPLVPGPEIFALLDEPHDKETMLARRVRAAESAYDEWQRKETLSE